MIESIEPSAEHAGVAARETAVSTELSWNMQMVVPWADRWTESNPEMALKRLMDVVLSAIGLVILFPFLLLAAAAIVLDSPGPVIFRQKRLGRHNKEFILYKLRTMVADAEKNGPKWADPKDERVTRVGRFLRRTRFDEVPQLWNVFKGEMSLIGPRPERKHFVRLFMQKDPRFAWRTLVKPGLTGWAQINGGYDLDPIEKLEYDLEYIKKHSIMMDLKILLRTVSVVLKGEGSR